MKRNTMNMILDVIVMLLPFQSWAQDDVGRNMDELGRRIVADTRRVPPAFEALETVAVKGSYHPEGVHVHYNPSLAEVQSVVLDGVYREDGKYFSAAEHPGAIEAMGHSERVLITSLTPDTTKRYTIVFSPGLSADPYFLIFDVAGDSLCFCGRTTFCTDIYIPGDGYIYTSGHADSMFDVRRKYTIRDGGLVEIPQPMLYVGMETVTTKKITLTHDRGGTGAIAELDAGTSITVLVNDGDDYLVLTPQGITGWTRIPSGLYTPIRYLMFRGD